MRRAVLLIGIALVVRARYGWAECAIPHWNGTESGPVPTRGSLYVYDESLNLEFHNEHEVRWEGPSGMATETRLGADLLRIDYEGLAGSALIVNRRRYLLSSTWRRPVAAPRVTSYWHQLYAWTCSRTNSLMIQIDQPTAAIRARWTFQGSTTEWLIPSPDTESTSEIELGKINCGGTTLPPAELLAGGHLELVAIRMDDSEVKIVGLPVFLSAVWMPTIGSDERDFDFREQKQSRAHSRVGMLAWGGIALLLLVGCVCVFRILRERATTDV